MLFTARFATKLLYPQNPRRFFVMAALLFLILMSFALRFIFSVFPAMNKRLKRAPGALERETAILTELREKLHVMSSHDGPRAFQ
jgi:hypothetical protein